jgi:hypothetical protein
MSNTMSNAEQVLRNALAKELKEKHVNASIQSYKDYTDMVRKGEELGKQSMKQEGYRMRKFIAKQWVQFGVDPDIVQEFVNSLRPRNNNSKLLATIAELEAKIAELTKEK